MAKKSQVIKEKEQFELLIAKEQYRQLTTPWYKKLEPWKSISWSLLTLLTILVMYKNGLFDFRMKEIELTVKAMEAKRDNLEFDIKKNATWKDSLYVEQNRLIMENKVLENQQIQMALANKKMYENLDDRGKRMYDLTQQFVALQKAHQRLIDEKEFSPGILPWKNTYSPPSDASVTTGFFNRPTTQPPSLANLASISDISRSYYESNFTTPWAYSSIIPVNTNATAIDLSKFNNPVAQESTLEIYKRILRIDTIIPFYMRNPVLKN